MKVKIKKLHRNAIVPKYAKEGDAGLDLTALGADYDEFNNIVYTTGLAVEIPDGFVGYIFPRSSISKTHLTLCNSVGVIDSGYRGEIMVKFKTILQHGKESIVYQVGDRIAQLIIMPYPKIEFEEVDELSDSERGEGGFGSTNK